jgi:hypothetical protein
MSLPSETKINKILKSWPSGTVGLAVWLEKADVSRQLRLRYQKSGWLESLGRGAFKRSGDSVDWLGGLYGLQKQAGLSIHVGARTALGLQGQAHYLELNAQTVQLFAPRKTNLPAWFKNHDWGVKPELHNTDFLPTSAGLVEVEHKLFSIKASSASRAIMECLYLAPDKFDLVEAYQIMEGMGTLRPAVVQQLLEQCDSVKVKRLFLYMAEKASHAWFKHLDLQKIDLGSGTRGFTTGGVYVSKYRITVPQELA